MTSDAAAISGYDFGSAGTAISPLSEDDLRMLEQTVGWTDADAAILQEHAALFRQQAETMVDAWRAVIGSQPHLAQWFLYPNGNPDDDYKARVKRRFVQWVVDVATRPHDRAWLNYQEEIGLRHTPAKKNRTDGKHAPPLVPLRYLLGFVPVVLPVSRFFVASVPDASALDSIQIAWTRAVLLHITLWSRPYTTPDLW